MATAKEKRKRQVFGRRKVTVDDVLYIIELRKDRILAREKWSRRGYTMKLDDLVDVLIGQLNLR